MLCASVTCPMMTATYHDLDRRGGKAGGSLCPCSHSHPRRPSPPTLHFRAGGQAAHSERGPLFPWKVRRLSGPRGWRTSVLLLLCPQATCTGEAAAP